MDFTAFKHGIFNLQGPRDFNAAALSLFRYQYNNNPVYHSFADAMGVDAGMVYHLEQIPFLPVSFFKTRKILTGEPAAELVFESSGTTGEQTSRHYIADAGLYESSFLQGFELFYGDISEYAVFALLPSYFERGNSSLVHMVNKLMMRADKSAGGFFLHDIKKLQSKLAETHVSGHKIFLIGVTYALLEMAENFPVDIPGAIVVETGGMKGRRREITRMELHEQLSKGFGVSEIHSEYGMTELLSQAWSKGSGIFRCPPWMKILIADTNDPLSYLENGRTGGINVVDLANIHSCSFLATQDLGRLYDDEAFEVLGRFDASDTRGCSLLAP